MLMLGVYLVATIVGAGLLLVSLAGGGNADADGDLDTEAGAADDGGGAEGVAASHGGFGQLLIGFFRPRNLVFGAAGFGLTGTVLTLLDANPAFTALAAAGLGATFFLASHAVFTWLRRSEAAIDPLSDAQLMGERARVTLPLEPGHAGRVACLLGGREVYLTARLGPGAVDTIPAGNEVVVVRVADGVAEVLPPELYERQLPA